MSSSSSAAPQVNEQQLNQIYTTLNQENQKVKRSEDFYNSSYFVNHTLLFSLFIHTNNTTRYIILIAKCAYSYDEDQIKQGLYEFAQQLSNMDEFKVYLS